MAQPRTAHTEPILLQAGLGEVSGEEGPGLLSPLPPRRCPKGFPEFCSHANCPEGSGGRLSLAASRP